jgi:hypothetical protein
MEQDIIVSGQSIQNRIYTIRGLQVMLDRDLAELYGVENRVLNQAVKRNIDRFPEDFMFQLTKEEFQDWKSQIVISNADKMGLRKLPYVFTEQGVSMLSSVLRSDTAVKISIEIVRAFVHMRRLIASNMQLFQRFERIEQRLLVHDGQFEKIFKAIEDKSIKPTQGIFYDGQVFDAYVFVSDLIKGAKKSIVLIDNYVDESVLTLFSKNQKIHVIIYSQNISKQLKLDLKKYNAQYKPIEIKPFKESHDRFMIIDETEVYHFGASLKDLGKRWFAFSKFYVGAVEMLGRLS